MAERVTDLRDIERRITRTAGRRARARRAGPDRPVGAGREDLAPADTAGLDPALVLALVTERAARPATPRSSPASSASPAWSASPVRSDRPGARRSWSTARRARSTRSTPTRSARRPRGGRPRTPAAGLATWTGPAHRRRRRREAAGQRRRRPSAARPRQGRRSRGSACSAPSCASSTARTSRRSRSRPRSTPRCSRLRRGATSWCARSTPARTSRSRSRPTEGEENPALGVRGLRLSFDNPGLLDRQLDAIALAAARTGTETWVMAPMVATVPRRRLRRAGPRARAEARRHGRGAERRAARPTGCSRSSTSCRSAPTTSRSTRWPPTGWPPTSPTSPTRGSRPCSS
jgi:phosphotransferase system enzyme I (PtsI)